MAQFAPRIRFVLALLAAGSASVWAQSDPVVLPRSAINPSLQQASPISRVTGVTQFGMPGDEKFIFCDGADCPLRSRKRLSEPLPVAAALAPKEVPAEEFLTPQTVPTQMVPPRALKPRKQRVAHKPVKRWSMNCRGSK